jgi:hypothetical protein
VSEINFRSYQLHYSTLSGFRVGGSEALLLPL